MAWPFVVGQTRPRDLINFLAVPALRKGFSVRPALATTPIMALH